MTPARWRLAGFASLAVLLALVLATFADYGVIWDEEVQYLYGEYVLRWYTSGFTDRSAMTFADLWLYGGLFEVVANLAIRVLPFGIYETRHLVTALVGIAGVAATWRLGALVAGEMAGFLSALLLAFVPAWYGHAFANPKDIPFAAFAALSLLAIVRAGREAPRVPWRFALVTGIALGAALGVRVGGAFLLGYLGLFWTVPALLPWRGWRAAAEAIGALAPRLVLAVTVAWFVMLLGWPWAQENPLLHPVQAISSATHFKWIGPVLFDGEQVASDRLPLRYLPTWFAITLPEAHLLALVAGGVALGAALFRRSVSLRAALDLGAVGFAVALPFIMVLVLRPVMYDAHRQFLFVLPPLAVLAAAGLVRLCSDASMPRSIRIGVPIAVAGSLALTAVDMARLHPFETVYFNRVTVGGLPGAAGRFETDYWGQSYRAGAEAVMAGYRPFQPVKVANCAAKFQIDYWFSTHEPRLPFFAVRVEDEPDLVIATSRYRCMREMGTPIHSVTRMGVPLVTVFERRRVGVWTGPPPPAGFR